MSATPDDFVRDFLNGEGIFKFRVREFLIRDASEVAPEIAWQAIVELSRRPLDRKQIALLAAGPLETLIAFHGEAFIDRIEREARVYPAFRHLLGGVWRNEISQAVWDRLEKIRGTRW